MNLPNKLTVARIIAVPFFIGLYMTEHYFLALFLFILASLTDMLDGQIARARGLITNFGKIMDPLADKILVYSAFCLLVADEDQLVPAWMLAVILAREFLVAGMRTVAASEGIVIAADMSGKIKTVLQMIAVPLLILTKASGGPVYSTATLSSIQELTDSLASGDAVSGSVNWIALLAQLFLWASLVMTVVSGIQYVMNNKSVFRQ